MAHFCIISQSRTRKPSVQQGTQYTYEILCASDIVPDSSSGKKENQVCTVFRRELCGVRVLRELKKVWETLL